MSELIAYHFEDGIATLTLSNGKVNAISPAVVSEFNAALDQAEKDRAVVIITGTPGILSGGYDLKVMTAGPKEAISLVTSGSTLARRMLAHPFPVIVVSARGDWTEKVEGIESGADDYLSKPFQLGELVARVRGLVRRGAGKLLPVISVGRLRLDTLRMVASVDGVPVRTSPLEFRLLDYLAHQSGRAVSSGELAEHLYGTAEGSDANAIEAIVARLRRKIGSELIQTRRGFGYLLEGE